MKTLHITIIISVIVLSIMSISVGIIQLQSSPKQTTYQYETHEPYNLTEEPFTTMNIQNKTFFIDNISKTLNTTNSTEMEWYGIKFSFPHGSEFMNTPGGEIFESYVTFPDDPVPYRIAVGQSSSPASTPYDFTTVLSTHTNPQAGFTSHNGTIWLLVNWPKVHSDLQILGLNETIKTGQPLDFQVEAKGFGYFNGGQTPRLWIERQNGSLVWSPIDKNGLVLCCPAELVDYDRKFNFTDLGGPIVIDKPGSYKVVISYDRLQIQKQFSVISPKNISVFAAGITMSSNVVNNTVIPDNKTLDKTKQVHYYNSSNINPKVSLYDYFYNGIEKDGIVTINNQTFYQTTLDYNIYNLPKNIPIQFHNVTFSFPEGTLITPGGAFVTLDVNFQDGNEEIYGGTTKTPDGSGTMLGGISIPTISGPHLATNSTTILGNHTMPQAGITMFNDKIKLLVSTGIHTSQRVNSTSALKLYLSTDSDVIKPGQEIGITISVNNTLTNPVDISSTNNWSYGNISTGPCSTIGYGVSILDGFYDSSNITQGKNLDLFFPGILCPVVYEIAKVYEFQPSTGNVKQIQCKQVEGIPCAHDSFQMGQHYKFNGYWDQGKVQPFSSGVKTLVGADEWGHMEIRHFIVTNSTIFAGDLGAMSCPLPLGFSAHITDTSGFAAQFSQSANYFILHPGMQGTIQLQYDTPSSASWFQNNANVPFNLTNGATLLYMADITSNHITTPFAVSQYHDDAGFHSQICHYNGMFAEPCNYDNKGNIPPNEIPEASELLHSGIDMSYTPKSIMVYPNGTSGFTVTISANSNAKEGVFWLSMGRSLCGPGVLTKIAILP